MMKYPVITTMKSPVTPKEVFAHLLVKVLELHINNITALKDRGGVRNYKKLLATLIELIEKLYKSEHITLTAFQYISDWKIYVDDNQPSYNNIMTMTSNT